MCVCVCVHVCVCVRVCVIEMINPELCRAKHLKEVYVLHLFSQPVLLKGGSPTDEATKKLVSDVRDQLLQGLAIMQRQSGIAKW